MKLNPEALEVAAETHWLAINTGSRSPWAEVEEPIREEIRALIRADITAYLDALVESGRAKKAGSYFNHDNYGWRADTNWVGESQALIIRLDGGKPHPEPERDSRGIIKS